MTATEGQTVLNGCQVRVVNGPGGWSHLDTHGVDPGHPAGPECVPPARLLPQTILGTRETPATDSEQDERLVSIQDETDAALPTLDELNAEEQRAIGSLQALAKRWPRSLTLASMGGELCVVRTGDPRFHDDNGSHRREDAVVVDIRGIPNTGGDW